MYGSDTAVGSGVLAATGIATGWWILTAAGILLAAVAIYLLVRPNKKVRP